MAITTSRGVYDVMHDVPGTYYLIVAKMRGKSAFDAVIATPNDLKKWIETQERMGRPRFKVFRLVPVAKYVKKRGARKEYLVKRYGGGILV